MGVVGDFVNCVDLILVSSGSNMCNKASMPMGNKGEIVLYLSMHPLLKQLNENWPLQLTSMSKILTCLEF